jgi:hypothetical protein
MNLEFLEWFKKVWIGRQHHITPDMINKAAELLNDNTLSSKDTYNFNKSIKIINDRGLNLLMKENEYKKDSEPEEIEEIKTREFISKIKKFKAQKRGGKVYKSKEIEKKYHNK